MLPAWPWLLLSTLGLIFIVLLVWDGIGYLVSKRKWERETDDDAG